MNNDHYFSDITELFVKAKKEEQIDVNPQVKNAVREMLKYKISEAKGGKNWSQEKPRIFEFFRKWKYQLVGVPASLVAIMVVVFAASNLQFAIPKEEVKTDVQRSGEIRQAEVDEPYSLVVEEDEVDPSETDRALLRTIKKENLEPLSLNINDLGKVDIRTLNKLPEPEPENYIPETPTVPDSKELLASGTILEFGDIDIEIPKIEFKTPNSDEWKNDDEEVDDAQNQNDNSQDKSKENEDKDKDEDEEKKKEEESSQEPSDDYIAAVEEEPTEVVQDEPITEEPTEVFDEEPEPIVAETTATEEFTAPSMIAVLPKKEQTLRHIYTERDQIFVKEVTQNSYPIYYFRDSILEKNPEFDEVLLKNISAKISPSSMTVYYTLDNKVVVEVALEGTSTTKWYLFERVNGSWTIQKYEKEILDDVVK